MQEDLTEYMIPEYLFYDSAQEDENTWVDLTLLASGQNDAGAAVRASALVALSTGGRPWFH